MVNDVSITSADLIGVDGLPLYTLRTFHLVASQASFTRAGQRLNLSQPAVSGQIRALERRVGSPLFAIRHRRPYLTTEGEALFEYTTRIFDLLRQAEHAVAATQKLERGHLTLAASSTVGAFLLPQVIRRFLELHPLLGVEVAIDTSDGVIARVLSDAAHLGLVEAPVHSPGVEVTPFAEDEMVLIAPPGHALAGGPLTISALQGAPLIRREADSVTQQYVDSLLEQAGVTMRTALVIASTEAVRQAVLAGIGLAWVPRITVAREVQAGDLVTVSVTGLRIMRPLSSVVPRATPLAAAARAFLALLRASSGPSLQ